MHHRVPHWTRPLGTCNLLQGRKAMKIGDLVRWRADDGMGIILQTRIVSKITGSSIVYVLWFDGNTTGPIEDDHKELELVSESR